ncbi:DUF4123 domain-containing protein [Providencia rustigianii]|uniref:DUF4123 domain-containing protein n=1 Tax=Providencia rustigianii TaxID=158850 RepID=UPI00224471C4|nr:DUF4123 domain-containing protein [Providencia rustigianii]
MNNQHPIFNYFERYPDAKHYCLICGLQYERYFDEALQNNYGTASPLFKQPSDTEIAWAGPWLIDVTQRHHLLADLIQLEAKSPSLSWLVSDSPINKLAVHFSERLNVSLPDGKTALFRFYDPRVTHNMPQILTSEQFNEITTPLTAWYYRFEGRFYALQGGRLNAV